MIYTIDPINNQVPESDTYWFCPSVAPNVLRKWTQARLTYLERYREITRVPHNCRLGGYKNCPSLGDVQSVVHFYYMSLADDAKELVNDDFNPYEQDVKAELLWRYSYGPYYPVELTLDVTPQTETYIALRAVVAGYFAWQALWEHYESLANELTRQSMRGKGIHRKEVN